MSGGGWQEPPEIQKFALLPKILNGGIGGIMGVTFTFPLDLVKTRLQSQQAGPDGRRMYSSLYDCFMKTYRAEGLSGMYRGALVNIAFVTPEKAIKLSANDYFCYKLGVEEGPLTLLQHLLAAGAAGLLQVVVTTPMELIKIQLQNAGRLEAGQKNKKRITAISLFTGIFRQSGILGLYRGIGPTMLRDVSFSLVYFPLFAKLSELGPRNKDGTIVFWYSFLAGMGAGCSAALSVTPQDVIKTRLQTLRKAAGEREFTGIVDCFQKTLRNEGVKALFNGGFCRMAVIAPFFGIAQMIYLMDVAEMLLDWLR